MGERYYTKPDTDILYPSVTTILGATAPGDRQKRIIDALQKPGGLKRRELARHRGNELDRLCKDYLLGLPMTCAQSQHMNIFRKLQPTLDLMRSQSEAIACDLTLYHEEYLYAGTCDIILYSGGTACVVDLKTSASRQLFTYGQGDAWLQVIAYGMAMDLNPIPVVAYGILLGTYTWAGLELCTEPLRIEGLRKDWLKRLHLFGSVSDDGTGGLSMEDLKL